MGHSIILWKGNGLLFLQRYNLITLAVLLWAGPLACRQGPTVPLQQSDPILWFYDAQNKYATPPPVQEAWQGVTEESFDDKPINPEARAWFAYPLPENKDLSYLILTKCTNVVRVFQDQQLMVERTPDVTYPNSVRIILGEPFLVLPNEMRPSQLFLETFYSDRSGYQPACHDLILSDQEMALYHFLATEVTDLASGAIVIFMGIGGFLLYGVKGGRVLLYFSLAATTMSLSYMTGTDLAYVLFAHKPMWRLIWHLLLVFSPIPFFLFIESIMPKRQRVAWGLALLNLLIFVFFLGAWLWDHDVNFDGLRRTYYKILIIQVAIFLPFTLKWMFEKSQFAMRLGVSLVVMTLAAMYDIGHLLFSDTGRVLLFPWALIGFISILLSIMVQKTVQSDAEIQRAKAKLIADRNRKLQSEVDRRTADLNRRNSELEQLHLELEDHHEILANQKEKVAIIARDKDVILSRIAELRNQSIPKIFNCLQQLHVAFDDNSFNELSTHINLLTRTLEPAAHLYEKNHSISKKRLLILDADRKHQRIYRMAIGGSKVDLQIAENPQDFLQLIQQHPFDLLALHQNWLSLAAEIVKDNPHSRIVVMSSEESLKNLTMMRQNPNVAHIIPLNLPRLMLQQILLIHLSKLLTRDIFGIEKYLAWGFEVKEKPLPTVDQRDFLVRQLREDLEKMGLEADGIDAMAEITSCLLSIKKAHALVTNWSPQTISTPLQQLRYGFDASLVALSMDLRGQLLSQQELIVFLERHIQESEAARSLPSLARLLQLADALIINSDGDKRHELIVLIFLEKNSQGHQPAAYFHFESR
ncbi:MAG: 7TM-DISM domain-containing protein [Pseudobdellovibrionaceae bacterium]|nr:7TM-DISM domain-containing protein [Pseudobdellovibrionaceae bacterium]